MNLSRLRDNPVLLLMLGATIVAASRYVTVFAFTEQFRITGLAWAWFNALSGLGMAILEGFAVFFCWNAWSKAPASAERNVLLALIIAMFVTLSGAVMPTLQATTLGATLPEVMPGPWLWLWSGCVTVAPFLVMGASGLADKVKLQYSEAPAASTLGRELSEVVERTIKSAIPAIQSPTERFEDGGYVYIVRAEMGQCKIGIAVDVNKRFSTLRTASPLHLELVHAEHVSDPAAREIALHRHFRALRIRGEWFDLNDAQIQSIIDNTWASQDPPRRAQADSLRLVDAPGRKALTLQDVMRDNPHGSITEWAQALKISRQAVAQKLKRLEASGQLRRNGHIELIDEDASDA
jgi:hypothetical protein